MAESSIEWTEMTWNPVAGCSIVSPGCTNCYAMRMAARLEAMGVEKYQGLTRRSGKRIVWRGHVRLDHVALTAPLQWKKPRRVFVNSMSDLFHEGVPSDFIVRVWSVMEAAERHTFQILTKRPERLAVETRKLPTLPNVWLGVSVENADHVGRLDDLRKARAATRFVSFEPLLGSVAGAELHGIDWAIVGGESGPRARPMERAWVEEIREACHRTETAFFFKQWGGVNKAKAGRELDGRTWDEYPSRFSSEYAAQSGSPAE
jgi:protein gp37